MLIDLSLPSELHITLSAVAKESKPMSCSFSRVKYVSLIPASERSSIALTLSFCFTPKRLVAVHPSGNKTSRSSLGGQRILFSVTAEDVSQAVHCNAGLSKQY